MLRICERVMIQVDTSLNTLWPVCCQRVCLKHGHRKIGVHEASFCWEDRQTVWRKSKVVMDRFLHLRAEWSSKNSSALNIGVQGRLRKLAGLNEKYTVLVIKCTHCWKMTLWAPADEMEILVPVSPAGEDGRSGRWGLGVLGWQALSLVLTVSERQKLWFWVFTVLPDWTLGVFSVSALRKEAWGIFLSALVILFPSKGNN